MGSTEAMATDDLLRRPATGPRGPATETGREDWPRRLATDPNRLRYGAWPLLSNDRMQQTAPRVGRAVNEGVYAAAACSLSLAPAPLLIRVFDRHDSDWPMGSTEATRT